MTNRKLIWKNIFVDLFIFTRPLEKIESFDGGWSTIYIDKKTGQEWLKYSVDPEKGIQYNLIPYNPLLTTEELLDIAFTSKHSDEVNAAAYRLYYEEFYEKKESRSLILARIKKLIETHLTRKEKNHLINIIQETRLIDNVNHREIVGKHYTEVENDAKFYQETANEAQSILELLNS